MASANLNTASITLDETWLICRTLFACEITSEITFAGTRLLIYFHNKILKNFLISLIIERLQNITALETLTQEPKINKLWTLVKLLLESHTSHTIQFFVTTSLIHGTVKPLLVMVQLPSKH